MTRFERSNDSAAGTPRAHGPSPAKSARLALGSLGWRASLRALLVAGVLAGVGGCAGVKVASVASSDYIALRRGDILTIGQISASTASALHVVGIDASLCRETSASCRTALRDTGGLSWEQRLSALTELWILEGMQRNKRGPGGAAPDGTADAYVEAARHAYAYLFFTERSPGERALEERQSQVKDYYNFAVQESVTRVFKARGRSPLAAGSAGLQLASVPGAGNWTVQTRVDERLGGEAELPLELIPASSLTFKGLRNQYRRDGIGAALVAVTARSVSSSGDRSEPFRETPFPASTVILSFPGKTVDEVLSTREVHLAVYDPYRRDSVVFAGSEVPLAADFTAGYGLWLARSGFGAESVRTLLGKGKVLNGPRVYLMQPYDPSRRIVVMLHGLASSPEAWINVANEVLGDETLRRGYQIWQVYYPTNVPIPVNNIAIRKALEDTFRHVDPAGTAPASRDAVLVGHSMGGLLSRLMVSSSGEGLWQEILRDIPLKADRFVRARDKLVEYMTFSPLPQVGRAVFIAAPHRGTPVAQSAAARWAANLVSLPATVLGDVKEIVELLAVPNGANPNSPLDTINGIRNLSDADPFIRAASNLHISPAVRYHSIIATEKRGIPTAVSSDGLVPYRSAHLAGASSEKLIESGHSVQESAPAILEIRRILNVHLKELEASGTP